MNVFFYQKSSGRRPVIDFLEHLPSAENARIVACIENFKKLGFDSLRVEFRQIKKSLWEMKIRLSQNSYRIFYVSIHSDSIVLLHAYKKKTQKAPVKEILLAERRLKEVLKNENLYVK